MLRTFFKKLLGLPPPDDPIKMVEADVTVPHPANEDANKAKPPWGYLRRREDDRLVLPGTTVRTKNGVIMFVAAVSHKPPYVICDYKRRRLAVRADNIGLYFDGTKETMQ